MAPSKLSPAERAFRKREAARLRQQRCRERKRQANLKKKLEEQKKAEEMQNTKPATPISVSPTGKENTFVAEPPLPPLVERTKLPSKSHSVLSQTNIDMSDSFPSLKSDSSMMTEITQEENHILMNETPTKPSMGPVVVSPNYVMTDAHRPNQFAFRKDRPLPTPPLLSRVHSKSGRTHPSPHLPRKASKKLCFSNDNIELEAVHAMLALKSDHSPSTPSRKDYNWKYDRNIAVQPPSHFPIHPRRASGFVYDQGFEQGYQQGLNQSSYYHPRQVSQKDHRHYEGRSDAMIQARNNLASGVHFYYYDQS